MRPRMIAPIGVSVAVLAGVVAASGWQLVPSLGGPTAGAASPQRLAHSPGWRVVKVFAGGCGAVGAITSTGPKDAWATGTWYTPPCEQEGGSVEPLVARWNGSTWQRLQPPAQVISQPFMSVGVSVGQQVAGLSTSYAWIFTMAGASPKGLALLWDNGRWRMFTLTQNPAFFVSAAVFSKSNAWVFGYTRKLLSSNEPPFALRFNGRIWHQVPVPLWPMAAAAPSARNIWVVGTARPGHQGKRLLAHWTGRWHTVSIPAVKVPAGYSSTLVPQAILWDDRNGAWVSGRVFHDNGSEGSLGVLLHWTGKRWVRVTVSGADLVPVAHDGHGGLWLGEHCGTCSLFTTRILHYSASGVWSAVDTHVKGLTVMAMRLIPGTSSVWAGGAGPATSEVGQAPAEILKYGP